MNTRALFALSAFLVLHASLALQNKAQTPVPPTATGTYYYEGYDAANDRYVYIMPVSITDPGTGVVATTGTYYYVDSHGATTVGSETGGPITTPYRYTVTSATESSFQFHSQHTAFYSVVSSTDSGGVVTSATDFAVRSGTWFASDMTFHAEAAPGGSTVYIGGYNQVVSTTGAPANMPELVSVVSNTNYWYAHSGTSVFSGSNLAISSSVTTNSSNQALSIRNDAAVYLYDSTISKTVNATGEGSETIYMVGNQEGLGSTAYFYGEDLDIISVGQGLEAINQDNGHTITELYRTTITATISTTGTSQVIRLNDAQAQGGAHFYADALNLNVTNTGTGYIRAFSIHSGSNTITLKNSIVTTEGRAPVFAWEATTSSTGDRFEAGVTLENTNVTSTGSYSPIFQQIGDIGRITVTGGTLTTVGENSPIVRLIAQNDLGDSTRSYISLKNTVLDAQNASAFDLNIDAGATELYGQAGGGGKNIGTKVEDYYNILVQSSTVTGATAAMRIAAAGTGTSTYTQNTNLFVNDSTFSGGIEMVAGREGFLYNFASGGNLILTATNSVFEGGMFITGTEMAQRDNQAILFVYDSSWTGDITMTNRGNLTLQFSDTPIDGGLALSGSTHAQLRLANSPIKGNIHVADTARLTGYVVGDGQIGAVSASGGLIDLDLDHVPSGAITGNGNGAIALRIGGEVAIPDGIYVSGNANVTLTLRDTATLTADVDLSDRGTFAFAAAQGGASTLAGNVNLAGIWHIPGKTVLAGNLGITDPLGTISIANAGKDSLELTNGMTGKGRLTITSFGSEGIGLAAVRVIHDRSNSFASDALLLAHPLDNGLVSYSLENRSDGAYLIGGLGAGGAAVINSQSLAAEEWFAALTPLNHRFGQLRETNDAVFDGDMPRAFGDAGSFWFQGRADTTRVDLSGSTLDFDSRVIGLTVGGDTRWDTDTGTYAVGVYAATSRTDRDFEGSGDGHTTSAGGGLYFHYQHRTGIFASAIARFDIYETSLGTNSPNNDLNADYQTRAGGAAIDIGWHYTLDSASGWWFEPAYQLGLVKLPGVSYTTESNRVDGGNIIDIDVGDTRATQHVFRFAFGRKLNEKWNLRGHVLAANVDASGGKFNAAAHTLNATDFNNTDRTIAEDRVEISIGVSRRIGQAGRLNLDLSYTEADSYDRPCSVFLGYTHRW